MSKKLILIALGATLLLNSCGTVVPHSVGSNSVDYQNNEQNGGIIGVVMKDGGTPDGWMVTPQLVTNYNRLIGLYKMKLKKAIFKNDGCTKISEAEWHMTNEAMVDFLDLKAFERRGDMPDSLGDKLGL